MELQHTVAEADRPLIDGAIERMRRGETRPVEADLQKLQTTPLRWASQEPATQAKILRLLASCRLDDDDLGGAERLADEADGLHPPEDEPRLRALIAYRKAGPEAGLVTLGEPSSRDGANLRLALLIAAGRHAEAHALLDGHPLLNEPDADTWRLRAVLAFEEDQRDAAADAVIRAQQLAPGHIAVHQVACMVHFARALSPAVRPAFVRAPNPVDPDLVKTGEVAQRALGLAEQASRRVLELMSHDHRERMTAETRLLAVLACRRQDTEARAYASELLRRDPTHWGAIAWSHACGFDFDRATVFQALKTKLKAGTAEATHLIVALQLQLSAGKDGYARRLFNLYAPGFRDRADVALLDSWNQVLAVRKRPDDPGIPLAIRFGYALRRCSDSGHWDAVAALLVVIATDDVDRHLLLPASGALAAAGRWEALPPYIDILTDRIGTAPALHLAAHIAFSTRDGARTLALIERYRSETVSLVLPRSLRRLEAQAHTLTGNLPKASDSGPATFHRHSRASVFRPAGVPGGAWGRGAVAFR